MRWALVLYVVLSSVGVFPGREPGTQRPAEREDVRQVFLQRVDGYVQLHRHLEQLVPPEIIRADMEPLFAARVLLAREIRTARVRTRQGDILTPGVAAYLRVVIAETLRRQGIRDLLATIEEENAVHTPATVNGDYPAGRAIPAMPPCLLAALPALPPELRYSFIGRDLILWDIHAGLIVDFAPRALPILTS